MRPAPIGWHINKIQIQPIGCDFRGGGSIVEFWLPGTLLAALQDSRRFISPRVPEFSTTCSLLFKKTNRSFSGPNLPIFWYVNPPLGYYSGLLFPSLQQLPHGEFSDLVLVLNVKSAQFWAYSSFSKCPPKRRTIPRIRHAVSAWEIRYVNKMCRLDSNRCPVCRPINNLYPLPVRVIPGSI